MSRQRPDSGASFRGLTTMFKAYGLHLAVDMIVDRVGSLLSSAEMSFSQNERRRLTRARAALRAAQTHFSTLFSPADDEPANRRGDAQ